MEIGVKIIMTHPASFIISYVANLECRLSEEPRK